MNPSWQFGTSYFGVRDPEHVRLDMLQLAEQGLTFVVHTFSENDLRFYKDTMKEIIEVSKQAGLEVFLDPWGVCGIFGGEAFSAFVCETTQSWQVLNNGNRVPALCPNNPKTLLFLENWVNTTIELSPTGVFFDEPHFYKSSSDAWACVCKFCQKKFLSEFGYTMPLELTKDTLLFRIKSIANLIHRLSKIAKSGSLVTSLCLLPREQDTTHWTEFFKIPYLDIIGTDPYWVNLGLDGIEVSNYVKRFSKTVVRLAKLYGKTPQLWVQAFKIPKGTETNIKRSILAAVEVGIRNISVWSFKGTKVMSYIRSDRPDVVWETYISTIEELKSNPLSLGKEQ